MPFPLEAPRGDPAFVSQGFVQERSSFVQERTIEARTYSVIGVPYLRGVRGGLRFDFGATSRPNCLGGLNDLEDSEDCRSAGRHGNQHVCLRSAQIVCPETICPALAAALLLRAAADVPFSTSRHHCCFKTSLREIDEVLSFLCIDRPVESVDAVRRFAEVALPFYLPLKSVVAAGRLIPVLPRS